MFVIHHAHGTTRAKSAGAVRAALEKVQKECAPGQPELVTVENAKSGDTLSIGLGLSVSVLSYVHNSKDPPYFVSVGEDDRDEVVAFLYDGEWSEFPVSNAIPLEAAMRAMDVFCTTGGLSQEVRWDEPLVGRRFIQAAA